MSPERFDFLLQQYQSDKITQDQWEELRIAFSEGKFDDRMSLIYDSLIEGKYLDPTWSSERESVMWNVISTKANISESQVFEMSSRSRNPRFWWAAAAVFIVLGSGTYFYFKPSSRTEFPVAKVENPAFKNDVLPGTNKAVLTLANGNKIVLDSAASGLLAQEGNSQVQNQQGALQYTSSGKQSSILYNTLTTNKGEQYPLTLADGTKVWLNAASSIRYPVAFGPGERRVEITGEAYFEVTHDAAHPFHVIAGQMDVSDLGTHFNINAYPNEGPIKTTLLEGSVSINNTHVLKPGDQAKFESPASIVVIKDADVQGSIAWKNGLFHFDNVDISTIMLQVERWYDLSIVYEGSRTTDLFSGDIPRTATLTQLLSILQVSKVHFRLEEKKLTVLP